MTSKTLRKVKRGEIRSEWDTTVSIATALPRENLMKQTIKMYRNLLTHLA